MTIEHKNRLINLPPLPKEPEHMRVDRRVLGRRNEIRTQAILTLGPEQSGKTTFLKWLVEEHGDELGKIESIRCDDVDTFSSAMEQVKGAVDTVLIEAASLIDAGQINKGLRASDIPTGIVTLVDVERHELRKPLESQMLDTQLAVSDAIGLTWLEELTAEQIDAVLKYVFELRPNLPIIKVPKLIFGEIEIMDSKPDRGYRELFSEMIVQQEKRAFAQRLEDEDKLTPWSRP